MKELTIEEKARRYDEALERARKEYKNHEAFKGYCEMLEHIFTELKEKESKDEKIRKELINYFIKGKEYLSLCSFSKDEILTWLEKQGEKSIIIDVDKMVLKYSQTMDSDFGLPINCQIRAYRQGVNDTLRLEKQGDQKPYGQRQECADCQFNYAGECKGSCVIKKDECEEILEDATIDGNEDGLIAATIKYKNEQNPAWSEDDENMLRRVFDSLNTYAKNAYPCLKSVVEEEIDWLKSIKERTKGE